MRTPAGPLPRELFGGHGSVKFTRQRSVSIHIAESESSTTRARAFIYQTAHLEFADRLIPLITPSGTGLPLVSRLPVVFRPVFQYDTADTVTTLVAAVDSWAAGKPLPQAGARYRFNVSFFSSLDSQLVHPLMVLTSLDGPLM